MGNCDEIFQRIIVSCLTNTQIYFCICGMYASDKYETCEEKCSNWRKYRLLSYHDEGLNQTSQEYYLRTRFPLLLHLDTLNILYCQLYLQYAGNLRKTVMYRPIVLFCTTIRMYEL